MDLLANLFSRLIPKAYAAAILPNSPTSGPITDINFLGTYIGPRGLVITFIETIAGIIAVAMLVYSGALFLTSGGNPDRLDKAKKALYAAIIGLVIVLSSYIIVGVVVKLLGGSIL